MFPLGSQLLSSSSLQSLLQSPMGAFQASPLIRMMAQTQLGGQISGQGTLSSPGQQSSPSIPAQNMPTSGLIMGQNIPNLNSFSSSPILGGQSSGVPNTSPAQSNNPQWNQLISMLMQKLGIGGQAGMMGGFSGSAPSIYG